MMCDACNAYVAYVGDRLDKVLIAERELREDIELTTQQHTIRLATYMLDVYYEEAHCGNGREALQQMALGFSTAVTRLLAAQEFYGMPAAP